MRSSVLVATVVPLVLGLLGAAGCSGDDTSGSSSGATSSSGGSTSGCFDYTTYDGSAPVVSFATDVLPIFQQSCSLSTSCHGSEAGTGGRPYLGTKMGMTPTAEQIQTIFDQNVGAPSTEESGMAIIEPGDPEHSFLLYKMDGELECALLECVAKNSCGTVMPLGSDPISQDKRDTVRRWIAQGAKND